MSNSLRDAMLPLRFVIRVASAIPNASQQDKKCFSIHFQPMLPFQKGLFRKNHPTHLSAILQIFLNYFYIKAWSYNTKLHYYNSIMKAITNSEPLAHENTQILQYLFIHQSWPPLPHLLKWRAAIDSWSLT